MLTIQDKKYLSKTFATRKYLSKTFATREYLDNNFATRQYLDDNFVTKKDHNQFVDSVAAEFLQIHKQFRAIDKRFDKLENLIKEVLFEVKSIGKKIDTTIKRVDRVETHLGFSVA